MTHPGRAPKPHAVLPPDLRAERRHRTTITRATKRALARMDLARHVRDALPEAPSAQTARARVHVIAIGKAAPEMARGAVLRWSAFITEVLVVTAEETPIAARLTRDRRVEVLFARHPLPDRRSVRAGARCLEIAARVAKDRDVLLVLVSGGASALVCSPAEGVRLADKIAVTRAMLASGASIQEINVVRRHLSRIKGGRLAHAASPGEVITLAASDVIGGSLLDIGSGPSVSDTSAPSSARDAIARYAPSFQRLPLAKGCRVRNGAYERIVLSPESSARALAGELGAAGFVARVLPASQAPVVELANDYLRRARRMKPGEAFVRAAEPSLHVARKGRGGRSTHLAARVGQGLPPRGVLFAAIATDGVDGMSGTGGAIVGGSFAAAAGGPEEIARALARFESASLHERAKTKIAMHPSGHNLADLHVLLRYE